MKAVKSEREMRIALPSEVSVGDTVRIAEGPLKGIVGHVVKNDKKTVIMVTHNEAIKNMADHVIKLRDGAVRHNDINTNKVSAEDLEW